MLIVDGDICTSLPEAFRKSAQLDGSHTTSPLWAET